MLPSPRQGKLASTLLNRAVGGLVSDGVFGNLSGFLGTEKLRTGERHCISAVAFMVAGGGFEPPTFGLCDLTHLSMRVGLYLHPRGVLAIQSLRLPPPFRGLGSVLPYRSRDVGSTDFDE
jgi:hypothetical protein